MESRKEQPDGKNVNVFWLTLGAISLAYYLWGWHKEHVLQYWPIAIFLLCPLMHIFMHGGHGGHDQERR